MKRALLVLLLVPLLPGAHAADGVELAADASAKELTASAQAGQAVQATVGYTLDLAATTPLRLLSALRDGSGNGVAHNATWRLDGNLVGTTSGTTTLILGAIPAGRHTLVVVWSIGGQASGTLQLQAFARRDVSGESGSAAGVGGAIAQTSLRITRTSLPATTNAPAAVGGAVPVVLGLAFDRRPDGTFLSWGASIPATSAVTVAGPGGQVQRTLPASVRFNTDLGNLPDGVYDYNITARDEGGRVGHLAGRLRLQGMGSGFPLGAPLVQALAASLGQPLKAGSIFFLDSDRDSRPDRVVEADGRVVEVRVLEQQGRFVVHGAGSDALFLIEANTGAVRPVQAAAGTLGLETSTKGTRQVQVTVGDKAGWILVSLRDPHPGETLRGVQRADGTPLPTEALWQEDGFVQFLDDPTATYTLLYALPPEGEGLPFGTALGFLAAGLVGGALVTLLLRRRIQ